MTFPADAGRFSVTLCPPKYPEGCFPGQCRHDPQFVMTADVKIGSGRKAMEIDHSVCLACGLPQPATHGGNVFVDLHMLWERLGWHAEIGARLLTVRGKWAKIATYLFDENGWNGRHERIARLIDPKLNMALVVTETGGATRLGSVHFDPSYLRSAA